MNLAVKSARRRVKRYYPHMITAAVVFILVLSLAKGGSQSRESFAFDVLWPQPASYAPGNTPPNVYLQINYTGSGMGNFTYVISFDTDAKGVIASQGNVLVSNLSPFTAFAFIPTVSGSTVTVTGSVYANSPSGATLVYARSISI